MEYDEAGGHSPRRHVRGQKPAQMNAPKISPELRDAIYTLIGDHPRWGPRQIHAELRFQGWPECLPIVEYLYAGK